MEELTPVTCIEPLDPLHDCLGGLQKQTELLIESVLTAFQWERGCRNWQGNQPVSGLSTLGPTKASTMALIEIKGGALKKLIEVVSQGIGVAYKPSAIRNEADAEAYKMEKLARAEAAKTIIVGEARIELLERTRKRLDIRNPLEGEPRRTVRQSINI